MACVICYKDYISCGLEGILINGTLLPDTDYTWIITSPSGAKYSGLVTTDENGQFVIDTSTFPDMMLNPYAGLFVLEVQTSICEPAMWNDSAYCDPYTCIEFEARAGNHSKNSLGCECLGEPSSECCDPHIVAFTDVSELEIIYTATMRAKYGDIPTVQVWIYDDANRLVNMGVSVIFDANPATTINIDLGGPASGIVVIR